MNEKKSTTTKALISKSRWNITWVILLNIFFVFLIIIIIFSTMNYTYMTRSSYGDMYNICVSSYDSYVKQSALTPEPKQNVNLEDEYYPEHLITHDAFVVVKTDMEQYDWIYGNENDPTNIEIFEEIKKTSVTEHGMIEAAVKNHFYGVYSPRVYNYEIIPQTPSAEFYLNKNQVIFVCMNVEKEMQNTAKLNGHLLFLLFVIFVIISPLTYYVSGMLVQPMKKAVEKEKMFVANSSHELKTPLAIIKANGTVLSELFPEAKKYTDLINSECDKMNKSVVDMVNLTKLDMRKFDFEEVDLSSIVLNLCVSFDALAFEEQIKYTYEVEPGIILKKADRKVLQRILDILFDNAMKYVDGNEKEIRVKLSKVKNKIEFTIFNTGCEVKNEDLDKIFDRFYQGTSGSDVERKGSGLGLAILSQACAEMNYDISVESDYQKYMEFTIKF